MLVAPPSVNLDLPTALSLVNTDDLSVACSFRARPAATIVWLWSLDGAALPGSVYSMEVEEEVDGKYHVISSTLTWGDDDVAGRRGQGGDIICQSLNGVGRASNSSLMTLDILCELYILL